MLKAISHIALVVRDPARTAQLFERALGARIARLKQERKGPPETFLFLGSIWFVLVEGESHVSRSDDHIAFSVAEDELEIFAEKLSALGVESQVSRAGTAAKSLYFVDYDNHLFELHTGQLERDLASV